MPNCIHCHQPQTAAPVICSECYRALTERTVSMETDKLTEALRCCGNRDYKKPDCDHCPLLNTRMCVKVMLESAAVALEDRDATIAESTTLRAQLAEKGKQLAAAVALIDSINRIAFDALHDGPYQDDEEVKIFSRIEELTRRGPQEAGEVEHA